MLSNTGSFAQHELDILVKSTTDPENRPIIEEFIPEILALVDRFNRSGQSGGSAPYTATALSQAIKKLCLQEPICPITGIDDEWANVSDYSPGETWFQNKRCSALFKNEDNKPYYLDAIVWKDQKGLTFTGSAYVRKINEKYCSRQYVKSFPFTPKTFYIDVIMEEAAPDWWIAYIKDSSQLEQAAKYYNLTFEIESPSLTPPIITTDYNSLPSTNKLT
jgi:hypothetical protein